MALVSVETLGSRYDVRIEAGLIGRGGSLIRETLGERRLFVIADETVWRHYESRLAEGLQGCDWVALPMPPGRAAQAHVHGREAVRRHARRGRGSQ